MSNETFLLKCQPTHDNPHEGVVAVDEVRFSAGVCYDNVNLEIDTLTLKGGHYARFHYKGKVNNLGMAYHFIFGQWAESKHHLIDKAQPAFLVFNKIPGKRMDEFDVLIHVPLEKMSEID